MDNGYTKQIKSSGTQEVKAPKDTRAGGKASTVHRGTDLRTGGKKN